MPVITVVTPSYNQGEFLERTIQSVLGQGYPALEYIVMDGGSSDGSVEIIRRYSASLRSWCSERDGGQAAAIANGFAQSTGEVLCWLNSDDMLLPGALKAVGEYFRDHPQCEVANGGAYYIDEYDRPLRRLFQSYLTRGVKASGRRFRFYGQDGVYQQATFWRRGPYFAVGGVREKFSFAMDLDLFTRLAARRKFHVVRRYLACFRLHGANKSSTLEATRLKEVQWIRDEQGVQKCHPTIRMAIYGCYRGASLLRKFMLQISLFAGYEQLPPVQDWAAFFPVKRDAQD